MTQRGRSAALVRVLSLVQRLKRHRATLAELATEFGVHQRTIRRDLEVLSIVGFQVRNTADAYANGLNGFWWVADERRELPEAADAVGQRRDHPI